MSVKSQIDRIKADKEDIRAAIAEKGQSVPATALLSAYGEKIRAIQTGTDTSDATAAAGDILSGKTAYVDGEKVTGTIASRSASSLSVSGAAVKVPAGYYPSQVSKSVASATQATPSISVSAAGLVTAAATQSAGYVAAGTKSATKQLTTQAAQTITPGTADQTIASGKYLTGAQTVKGDANLQPYNIKGGISIFDILGTYMPSSKVYTDAVSAISSIASVNTVNPTFIPAVTEAPCVICIFATSQIKTIGSCIACVAYTTTARDDFWGATDLSSIVIGYKQLNGSTYIDTNAGKGLLTFQKTSSTKCTITVKGLSWQNSTTYNVIVCVGEH